MRISGINVTIGFNWGMLPASAAALFLAPMVLGVLSGLFRHCARKMLFSLGFPVYPGWEVIGIDFREF